MPRKLIVCVCVGLVTGCMGDKVHGESTLAALFDTSTDASATPGVLDGTWISMSPAVFTAGSAASGPGARTPNMALRFTSTTLTNATECNFGDGTVIYAGEVDPIQVDGVAHTITVLPSNLGDSDTESYEVYSCSSALKPGTVTFSIKGVSLSLSGGPYADGTFVKTSD